MNAARDDPNRIRIHAQRRANDPSPHATEKWTIVHFSVAWGEGLVRAVRIRFFGARQIELIRAWSAWVRKPTGNLAGSGRHPASPGNASSLAAVPSLCQAFAYRQVGIGPIVLGNPSFED